MAVTVAPGGSEDGVVHVIDAATGKPLQDTIDRVWVASVKLGPERQILLLSTAAKARAGHDGTGQGARRDVVPAPGRRRSREGRARLRPQVHAGHEDGADRLRRTLFSRPARPMRSA